MEFDDISAREMPHSIEAEQTVLGAVLLDSELLGTVMNYVKPESFYVSKHRELFSIILRQFTLGVSCKKDNLQLHRKRRACFRHT